MASRHHTLTTIALVGIIGAGVGVALGLVLFRGEDGTERATSPLLGGTEQTGESPTPSGPGPSPDNLPLPARRALAAVSAMVEAIERGDGVAFCGLVSAEVGDATGPPAVDACARQAGIDTSQLPTSDELQFKAISVTGGRATIWLWNAPTIKLKQTDSRWGVTGVNPAG